MTGWVIQLLVAAAMATPGVSKVPPMVTLGPEVETKIQVSPVASPIASPVVSPVPVVPVASRGDIDAWIEQYAAEYGVSAQTLSLMAKCESTFNPSAVNGLYGGMYQYSSNSWSSSRRAMGEDPNPQLRFDAREAIRTTAYVLSSRGGGMWPNCMPN